MWENQITQRTTINHVYNRKYKIARTSVFASLWLLIDSEHILMIGSQYGSCHQFSLINL